MNFIQVTVLVVCFAFSSGDEFHRKQTAADPSRQVVNVLEGSSSFWTSKAQSKIKGILGEPLNKKLAKNIIFFIGDGMGISTVSAARMYLGKEENELSFEAFPYYGLTKTYCLDKQVADSACTATAYLTGVKNNYRTIGVNGNVKSSQCDVNEDDYVHSIGKWAQQASKATGVVTTTRVTHASPAGVYAHTPHRDWESNQAVENGCKNAEIVSVKDIAYQLIHGDVGKKLKVILGGGRKNFINTTVVDEEGRPGLRTDGRNLIDEWLNEKRDVEAKYVWHKQQLDELNLEKTENLLGLFENDHCMYNLDITNNNLQHQEPSLTDMTAAAIKVLRKEEKGFFLFVEGGRIDMAHHDNRINKAMEETKEFARAIDVARKMTNEADTLIVVSADHSHVLTYSGHAERGRDILGISDVSDLDGLPYETLSYANGPGAATTYERGSSARVDLSLKDLKNPNRAASATTVLSSETHGGEDVGVWASGPSAHLFTGNYEQNNLPLLMAFAAQIGVYSKVEDGDDHSFTSYETPTTGSASLKTASLLCLLILLLNKLL